MKFCIGKRLAAFAWGGSGGVGNKEVLGCSIFIQYSIHISLPHVSEWSGAASSLARSLALSHICLFFIISDGEGIHIGNTHTLARSLAYTLAAYMYVSISLSRPASMRACMCTYTRGDISRSLSLLCAALLLLLYLRSFLHARKAANAELELADAEPTFCSRHQRRQKMFDIRRKDRTSSGFLLEN